MIFPYGDDQVKGGSYPFFSYAFIGVNIIIFLLQITMDPQGLLICQFGSIPNEITHGVDYFTLFSSMFMHGGWMHLIGNMLFLWVFADNIEATVGNFNFLVFYILGGLAASALHIYFNHSGVGIIGSPCGGEFPCGLDKTCLGDIPTVGASGAISAVLGAYLVMFPKSKVKVLVIYFFRSFRIAAFWFLGLWIGQQLVSGFASLGPETAVTGGTAWWAHIGGFIFGIVAGFAAKQEMNKGKFNSSPKPPPNIGGGNDFV